MKENKKIIKLITAIAIIILITIAGKIFTTVKTTLEQMWVEYQCPYDLHNEFILNKVLTTHKPHISFLSFGLLDNWTTRKQQELLNSIKEKISTDDNVWIDFWYDTEAVNWQRKYNKNSPEQISIAKKYMELLKDNNSKVVMFNKSGRYIVFSELAAFVAKTTFLSSNSYKEKYIIIHSLITDLSDLYKSIDMNFLLNQKRNNFIMPLILLEKTRFVYEQMFNLQINYNNISCSSEEVKGLNNIITQIYGVHKIYKDIIVNDHKHVDKYTIAKIEDIYKDTITVQQILNKFCMSKGKI